jgi:transposase
MPRHYGGLFAGTLKAADLIAFAGVCLAGEWLRLTPYEGGPAVTGTMTWAAMDVHARSIHAASLDVETGELSRRRFNSGAVEPVVEWLGELPGPVRAGYEAGPTGYGLYRAAREAGVGCVVIAPNKTPRASGDKVKDDRKDTEHLLRQLMAGALTPIAVPSVTAEAARDLARAREQVRGDLMRCRHRLSKLLLRHGRVWDQTTWTLAHRRWLGAQSFEQGQHRAGLPGRARRG